MFQHTCAIIKPDAVRDGNVGNILAEVVKNDMRIFDLYMIELTADQVKKFYAEHEGRPFFDSLIEFTVSGKMVAMVLAGENVIARWRQLIGSTDPAKAAPDTLRAKFGRGTPNNALHGSDSPASAEREIGFLKQCQRENMPPRPEM
jgi:nucleoside-diphosphate kinase